jgi:glucose/mannose-6-phosphate isomerase
MKIQEYVLKNDPQNQFNVLKNTYQQVESAWNNIIDTGALKSKKYNSIVVTGLGGSAISADLMSNFLGSELTIPFIINRNYHLPSFVDKNTLLIVSSYSGNTEETISVFNEGIIKKCSIICITTGGKIGKTASENSIPTIKVASGFQPRYSLGLSFFSLLKILQELNIISSQDSIVSKIISLWKGKGIQLSNESNKAIDIARELIGFIPVIYSAADVTSAAGYRLKCQFNENSKLHAFHNVIPELNHNEIIGWESFQDKQFNAKLILILDKIYHPQIKKRFDITASLISSDKIYLESNEEDFKLRLMDLIYLGDWISYYLALFRGFDPTEIENINVLKEKLA